MSEKPETKKRSARKQRVITGVIMAVVMIAILAIGGWVASLAVMLCLILAVREELSALKQGGHHPVCWVSYAALILAAPLMLYYSYVAMVPLVLLMCMCTLIPRSCAGSSARAWTCTSTATPRRSTITTTIMTTSRVMSMGTTIITLRGRTSPRRSRRSTRRTR